MVAWSQLVLPILLSSALVFVASSLIHMVLKTHNPDYHALENEDEVRAAIAKRAPKPAQYIIPHCLDPKQMGDPAMQKKFEEGPVAVLYVRQSGMAKLGPFLAKWTAYTVVISALSGYVARATLLFGASFDHVLQVAGVAAWLAYAWQGPSDSIWKGVPWVITLRGLFDGFVYALLTGASFALLWPR